MNDWEPVMFAANCDPSECDCIGPTEENVEYQEINGILYGRRV